MEWSVSSSMVLCVCVWTDIAHFWCVEESVAQLHTGESFDTSHTHAERRPLQCDSVVSFFLAAVER